MSQVLTIFLLFVYLHLQKSVLRWKILVLLKYILNEYNQTKLLKVPGLF